jgi:hypothetical protein
MTTYAIIRTDISPSGAYVTTELLGIHDDDEARKVFNAFVEVELSKWETAKDINRTFDSGFRTVMQNAPKSRRSNGAKVIFDCIPNNVTEEDINARTEPHVTF